MAGLFEPNSVVILLGEGGVGKTTIAASLGLAAALKGLNTAVITVDPAKRLQDMLGLKSDSPQPKRLSRPRLAAAGLNPDLPLSASMLDSKKTWDSLVSRLASDPDTRRSLLLNPFYRQFAAQFSGSETFAALEHLYHLHEEGGYDIEVIDTPPAGHSLDFLDAPARLRRLFTTPGARLLFGNPWGRLGLRAASRTLRTLISELERFAGPSGLSRVAEFFSSIGEISPLIETRFARVEELLKSPLTKFVLVTPAEPGRLKDAMQLADELRTRKLSLSAVVVNKFGNSHMCEVWTSDRSQEPRFLSEAFELSNFARISVSNGRRPNQRAAKIQALAKLVERYSSRMREITSQLENFRRSLPPEVNFLAVPEVPEGVRDLRGLARLANFLVKSA